MGRERWQRGPCFREGMALSISLSPSLAHFCWGAWLAIFYLFIFNKSASSRSAPGLSQDNTGSLPSAFGKEPAWGRREHTKRHLTGNFLFYKMKVTPCDATRGVKTQAGLPRREVNVEVTATGIFWKADRALLSPKSSSSYLTKGDLPWAFCPSLSPGEPT